MGPAPFPSCGGLLVCLLLTPQSTCLCWESYTPWFRRSPDTSKVKQKMLYASSKDALRKKLDGIFTEIQCTDYSEVSHETVLDKITRMTS